MSVVDWLRVFRAQTYPASLLLVLIFYFLGGGELISWYTLYLALFTLITHYSSFGHNSLMDSCRVPRIGELPYDVQDPNKKHHPLVSGRIDLQKAHKVIHSLLILSVVYGIVLVYFSEGNKFLATVCLLLCLAFGHAYNDGLDKASYHNYLVISSCFTAFGLFGYFLVAEKFSIEAILLAVYVFFLEWFENNVEGSLKEIETKAEKNIMSLLGCRVQKGELIIPVKAKIYGLSIKVISLLALAPLLAIFDNVACKVIYIVFSVITLKKAITILTGGKYDRDKLLIAFSIEEILSIFLPYFVLSPVLGFQILLLLPVGVAYFLAINKINWGVCFPKV